MGQTVVDLSCSNKDGLGVTVFDVTDFERSIDTAMYHGG